MSIGNLISDGKNEITVSSLSSPAVVEQNSYTGKRIEITVRQTQVLTDNNGRTPETMNVRALSQSFEKVNRNYKIWFNFPTWNAPNEIAGCSGGSLMEYRDFLDRSDVMKAKDSNILLTNATGGGCGGGNAGKVNAGDITEVRPLKRMASNKDGFHQAIYACLHEVGHQLGAAHDPYDADGNFNQSQQDRTWGHGYYDTWNDGTQRAYFKTPNNGINVNFEVQNACGETIKPDDGSPRILINEFTQCAGDNFLVK